MICWGFPLTPKISISDILLNDNLSIPIMSDIKNFMDIHKEGNEKKVSLNILTKQNEGQNNKKVILNIKSESKITINF